MLKIKSVTLKNVFCYEHSKIHFENGLWLLEGRNLDAGQGVSNMAGKTSLFDGITTALFEKNSKGQIKDDIKHAKIGGNASIIVDVEKNNNIYQVEYSRGDQQSWKLITPDGVILEKNWTDMPKLIESTLGITYQEFLLSSYFQQGRINPWFFYSESDRKGVFANWIGLFIFAKAREILKQEYKKLEEQYSSLKWKLDNANQTISEEVLNIDISKVDSILKKYKKRPIDVVSYRKERKLVLERLALWRKAKKVEKTYRELENLLINKKASIKQIEDRINLIKDDKCWVCETEINGALLRGQLQDKLQKERKEYSYLADLFSKIKKIWEDGALIDRKRELKKIVEMRHQGIGDPKAYDWAMQELAKIDQLNKIKKNTQIDQDKIKQELKEIESQIELYKFWDKGFSDDGIIAMILRKYLDWFNDCLTKYSSYFGFKVELEINTKGKIKLNVEDSTKRLKKIEYWSGSEQALVSFIFMLGVSDWLAYQNNGTNLMIFDEIFAPFDRKMRSKLVDFLGVLKQKRCVVVITHHEDVKNQVPWDKILVVEKCNGVSKILPDN